MGRFVSRPVWAGGWEHLLVLEIPQPMPCRSRAANEAFATRMEEPVEGVKINKQMELRGPAQERSA